MRRFLAELTADRPALVLLEDLHWADPASLDLLRHVGPHLRHWPLLLLATYRVDELTPSHPFAQQLPALVREADGQRLDLRRLDPDALRALVAARYRSRREQDEDRLVAYLERHAEGNPFFATELLRTLEEEALLRQDDDGWTLGEARPRRRAVPAAPGDRRAGGPPRRGDAQAAGDRGGDRAGGAARALGARWRSSTRRRCSTSSSGRSRRTCWRPSGTARASASSTP